MTENIGSGASQSAWIPIQVTTYTGLRTEPVFFFFVIEQILAAAAATTITLKFYS